MLMHLKDDEHSTGVRAEDLGRTDGDDLVGSTESHLFFEPLGELDGAKNAFRRGIEVIGSDIFLPILKLRDRHVSREGELLSETFADR